MVAAVYFENPQPRDVIMCGSLANVAFFGIDELHQLWHGQRLYLRRANVRILLQTRQPVHHRHRQRLILLEDLGDELINVPGSVKGSG